MDQARAHIVEADDLQELRHHGAPLGTRLAAQAEGDVALHRKVRKKRILLKHHADAALFRGNRGADTGHASPAHAYFAC